MHVTMRSGKRLPSLRKQTLFLSAHSARDRSRRAREWFRVVQFSGADEPHSYDGRSRRRGRAFPRDARAIDTTRPQHQPSRGFARATFSATATTAVRWGRRAKCGIVWSTYCSIFESTSTDQQASTPRAPRLLVPRLEITTCVGVPRDGAGRRTGAGSAGTDVARWKGVAKVRS